VSAISGNISFDPNVYDLTTLTVMNLPAGVDDKKTEEKIPWSDHHNGEWRSYCPVQGCRLSRALLYQGSICGRTEFSGVAKVEVVIVPKKN